MKKKLNCFLDLDQTLICSEEDLNTASSGHSPPNLGKYTEKAKKFTSKDMEGYYTVFERPGLQKFLDYLFANFNVSVWTAASKDYALFIIEHILLVGKKKERKLDWIFFSYHCDLSKRIKNGSKDLRMVWEEFKLDGHSVDDTFLFDDNPEVLQNNGLRNCVFVEEFEFMDKGSENDSFLRRVTPELKKMQNSSSSSLAEAVNDALSNK